MLTRLTLLVSILTATTLVAATNFKNPDIAFHYAYQQKKLTLVDPQGDLSMAIMNNETPKKIFWDLTGQKTYKEQYSDSIKASMQKYTAQGAIFYNPLDELRIYSNDVKNV